MHMGHRAAASYCDKRPFDIDLAIKRVGEAMAIRGCAAAAPARGNKQTSWQRQGVFSKPLTGTLRWPLPAVPFPQYRLVVKRDRVLRLLTLGSQTDSWFAADSSPRSSSAESQAASTHTRALFLSSLASMFYAPRHWVLGKRAVIRAAGLSQWLDPLPLILRFLRSNTDKQFLPRGSRVPTPAVP